MTDSEQGQRVAARTGDRAQALMEMGRHQQAIPFLTQALAAAPDDPYLHCRLAAAWRALGDSAKSTDHARRALHLAPDNAWAHGLLAWNHLENQHFDGALEHARAAVRIDPDDVDNLFALAWTQYYTGDYKDALRSARRALELAPDDAELHRLLGDLHLARDHHKEAVVHYGEALRHDAEDDHVHHGLGLALARQRKFEDAARHLLTAVKLQPANTEWQQHLFDLLYHDLLGAGARNAKARLQAIDPALFPFFQDQLSRRDRWSKLRTSTVVVLWIAVLALISFLFSQFTPS